MQLYRVAVKRSGRQAGRQAPPEHGPRRGKKASLLSLYDFPLETQFLQAGSDTSMARATAVRTGRVVL